MTFLIPSLILPADFPFSLHPMYSLQGLVLSFPFIATVALVHVPFSRAGHKAALSYPFLPAGALITGQSSWLFLAHDSWGLRYKKYQRSSAFPAIAVHVTDCLRLPDSLHSTVVDSTTLELPHKKIRTKNLLWNKQWSMMYANPLRCLVSWRAGAHQVDCQNQLVASCVETALLFANHFGHFGCFLCPSLTG